MPHKSRWFFAGRQRRMTLNQKATSTLETVNQTIKVPSGKKVTPNMSLRESIRTMDVQVQNILDARRIDASTKVRSRCLSTRSSTGDHVTKPCESQIAQQTDQSVLYACSLTESWKGRSRLLLKRLPQDPLYCADCETRKKNDEECCSVHSASSPIPYYMRIRNVDIISVGEDGRFYEGRCSCLYHPTFGFPCRHDIAVLFRVLPQHVFVRLHTKVFAYYKREHCEAITEEFHRRKHDLRLIITHEERDIIFRNAQQLESLHWRNLPDDFWQTKGAVCHITKGLVPLDEEDFDDDVCTDPFAGGFLSQDIALSQCQTEGITALNQDKIKPTVREVVWSVQPTDFSCERSRQHTVQQSSHGVSTISGS